MARHLGIWPVGGRGRGRGDDIDWRAYLERYPDLVAAGIDSRRGALRHWRRFGRAEGRWAPAPCTSGGRAMSCTSMHSMFLRAWGAVGCWDDAGSDLVLQPFAPDVDYAHDVYLGHPFAAIRDALRDGRLPFPSTCSRCVCLRSEGAGIADHAERRVMELFQAEPSFRCSLDCTGCVRRDVRRHAPRPHDLPPDVLAKVLGDLAAAEVDIRGFSFQGLGEPTASPDLATLAEIVKTAYPDGYLANCQTTATPELTSCGIDEFVCSVDGVDQSSFEAYRVGGDFARARHFMEGLCRARARGAGIRVVWRYVLFEHNDRDEHLELLAGLASDIGVDAVVLVFTQNGPASRRLNHPADLPRWTATVPVEVRWDGPTVTELDRRIELARRSASEGRNRSAAALLGSVGRLVERFWPSHDHRSTDQLRVLADLDGEIERLSRGPAGND